MDLLVKLLHPEAKLPDSPAYSNDAGYDIYSYSSYVIPAKSVRTLGTGLAICIPTGYVGFIKGRSSLARKGLGILGGVIDSGYTGEWSITIVNHSDKPYSVLKGDKIAQFVVLPYVTPRIVVTDEFDPTERGANGFGSTGR